MKFQNHDRILFTGDSVTDAGRGRPVGQGLWDGVGTGYVRSVDTLLNVLYPEQLFHIMNTGNGGDTSTNLLNRWEQDVVALKPDILFVCIGFNDVWRQFDTPAIPEQQVMPEVFEANLRAMIEKSKKQVREMVFMTPYYMEPNTADLMRARMDEYGAIMKKVCAEENLPCLDLQEVFCDYLQYRHSSYVMWDRVHPGWIGSMLIAKKVLSWAGADRPLVG